MYKKIKLLNQCYWFKNVNSWMTWLSDYQIEVVYINQNSKGMEESSETCFSKPLIPTVSICLINPTIG